MSHRVGWPVMACINGGRVWDVACVQVLWVSGKGKRKRIAGKDFKYLLLPLYLHLQGRRAIQYHSKRHSIILF